MSSNVYQQIIKYAENYAITNRFSELDSRQYLVALVNVDSKARQLLANYGINSSNVRFSSEGRGFGTLAINKDVEHLLSLANNYATTLKCEDIEAEHILLSILALKDCYAYQRIEYILRRSSHTVLELLEHVIDNIPGGQVLLRQQSNSSGSVTTDNGVLCDSQQDNITQEIPYGKDMTALARANQYDPVIGRNNEISRIIQILSRRTKNNAVLVGYAGVGKSAVVEGLAQAIASGQVPLELMDKRIIELDIASMVAGTRYRGDFEDRLKKTIDAVLRCGDVILFIDEMHNLVGTGGGAEGSMDAGEILKPVLARGALQTIGATTYDEYTTYIEKDPALERRFQPITVNEPTETEAIAILQGVSSKYEQHHKLTISSQAIESAVKLSIRYISDRYLPDKAFDLLDEACSKVRMDNSNIPEQINNIARQLATLKVNRENAISRGDMDGIATTTASYQQLYATYTAQVDKYKSNATTLTVTEQDVANVVSSWTGVPVSQLNSDERQRLAKLEDSLKEVVKGQDNAVKIVSKAIKRARAGIKSAKRPIGSFIFVGPTGVGKTELAKTLSMAMFGGDDDIIRLDMSEYMERQSVSRLIGASAGYVGYEDGGQLTERVRRRPYSVVLFDEVEKAHPDIFNILLQILDEGRLTDNHGKVVDFCNTVIIMTSNIGVGDVGSSIGFGTEDNTQLEKNCHKALKQYFRPELLNRIDDIVTFNYLDKKAVKSICTLLCAELVKRLKGVISLKFTDKAIRYLADSGYDKQYGARPIRREIIRQVEDVLAEKMIAKEIEYGQLVTVELYHDKEQNKDKLILDIY